MLPLIKTYLPVVLWALVEFESYFIIVNMMCSLPGGEGISKIINIFIIVTFFNFLRDQVFFLIGRKYYLQIQKMSLQTSFIGNTIRNINIYIVQKKDHIVKYFRLQWGIRVFLPFLLGANKKVSYNKFTFYNFVSSAIWAFITASIGVFLGVILSQYVSIENIHYGIGIALKAISVYSIANVVIFLLKIYG